jgi:hypothetical protein
MFRPLAWTKTLSVGFSSFLAITVVPALMVLFIRGRLRPESANPVSRFTQALYLPVLRFALRWPWRFSRGPRYLSRNRTFSVFESRQCFQHLTGPGSVEDRIVLTNFSIPEDQHTLSELGDVVFVSDQYDSQSRIV